MKPEAMFRIFQNISLYEIGEQTPFLNWHSQGAQGFQKPHIYGGFEGSA